MSEEKKTTYKLSYWIVRGLGEFSRVLFALAEQEFEDFRIPFEDWFTKYKAIMPFHQVPLLEVTHPNGSVTRLAQSQAIERYLANKFGLFGKDDEERARIDMICEQVNDHLRLLMRLFAHISGYARLPGNPDNEAIKTEVRRTLDEMPKTLQFIVNLYNDNQEKSGNSGFLVGDKATYADVKLVCLYGWFHTRTDTILDQVPVLREHYERVRALPQLKQYYEKTDKTLVTTYWSNYPEV
jgi:glutathione S-transferase